VSGRLEARDKPPPATKSADSASNSSGVSCRSVFARCTAALSSKAAVTSRQGYCITPGGVRLVSYMDRTGCHQLNVFWLSLLASRVSDWLHAMDHTVAVIN
jgi:hypothetical protein